jgi:hypothetical protein
VTIPGDKWRAVEIEAAKAEPFFLRIKIRSVQPIAAPERPIAVCCHGHTFAPF